MSKPTYDEVLQALASVVWQAAIHDFEPLTDKRPRLSHMYRSDLEEAFDVLERAGWLEYDDPAKRYWARLIWGGKQDKK